jgi:hypothetical protein
MLLFASRNRALEAVKAARLIVASDSLVRFDPESITMSPVDDPPRVRVPMLSDWIVEFSASSERPLPVAPERVATG